MTRKSITKKQMIRDMKAYQKRKIVTTAEMKRIRKRIDQFNKQRK